MTWEWVVLILGVVFNLTIILIAMSEGAQYGLATRSTRSGNVRGTDTEISQAVPEHETTRRV